MPTANTHDVFRCFFGLQLTGYMRTSGSGGIGGGQHVLIFEDGQALVVNDIGSHWVMPREEVARLVGREVDRLSDASEALRDTLALAGKLDSDESERHG